MGNMEALKSTPILIKDVFDIIVNYTPFTFLGANKALQKQISDGFVAKRYVLNKRHGIIALHHAASHATNEVFTALLRTIHFRSIAIKDIVDFVLYNQLYTKMECIGTVMRSINHKCTPLMGNYNYYHVMKYYELYGVEGIEIDDVDIIGTKWMINIHPTLFLPKIPLHLIPALYERYGDVITSTYYVYDKTLFEYSTPERIYEIFKHHPVIHHSLLLQLVGNGKIDYVAKLLDQGAIPSANDKIDRYIESYIIDPTLYFSDTTMRRLRSHLRVAPDELNDPALAAYDAACAAFDDYVEAFITGPHRQQIDQFIDAISKIFDESMDDVLIVAITLGTWNQRVNDTELIKQLSKSKHLGLYFEPSP